MRASVLRHAIPATLLSVALLLAPAATASAALDPMRTLQKALDIIHLGPEAPAVSGAGVTVAVLDTGVDLTHPDLAGRVIPGPDFVDGGLVTGDPHGHGTHLAGIIAAQAGNGQGGTGVAPAARIFAVRVLDARNEGFAGDLARGIDAAVAARVDVINLSLNWPKAMGSGTAGPEVDSALRRAADAGIAVIVAAGNEGLDSCQEPSQAGSTLCVGALDGDLGLAGYSSHGRGLGVVAPGSQLVSTFPGGSYRQLSGTSQAATVASGVAALVAGQGLRGPAIIERLQQTARDLGSPGYDRTYGFGLVDAARATDGAAEGRIPPLLRITLSRRAKLGVVRRKGLQVTCDAARAGTCTVNVRSGRSLLATGRSRVSGAGPVAVVARPTRAGRRMLARGRTIRAKVAAGLRGAPGARATVSIRP